MIFLLSFFLGSFASLQQDILSSHSQCKENHKHFSGETLAYITPWNALGYEYALKYPAKFTYISPVWHEISFYYSAGANDFSISGEENSDFLSKAKHLFKITPRLIITKTHPRAYISYLENDNAIQRLAEGIVRFAKDKGYQGFVLEFWLQGLGIISDLPKFSEYRSLQLRMLRKISQFIQKNGLISIITLPPMRSDSIKRNEFYEIINAFDRVNVMTYDYSPSRPGPNTPLPWIQYILSEMISDSEIDPKKVLLGVPFYGYDYKGGNGNPIIGKDFLNILQRPVKDEWDSSGREHKFTYKIDGRDCEAYYPTLDMIKERLDYAEKQGMGVAIWELGQGLEYFFSLF